MQLHRYIVDTSEPFRGVTTSATYLDAKNEERVAYSGFLYTTTKVDLTLAEYLEHRKDKPFIVLTWEEFEPMLMEFNNSLKTKPVEITEERYDYMLEVLPPSRWQNIRGASVFHVCERIHNNLVSWFVQIGKKYYEFVDEASLSKTKLESIIESLTIGEKQCSN